MNVRLVVIAIDHDQSKERPARRTADEALRSRIRYSMIYLKNNQAKFRTKYIMDRR